MKQNEYLIDLKNFDSYSVKYCLQSQQPKVTDTKTDVSEQNWNFGTDPARKMTKEKWKSYLYRNLEYAHVRALKKYIFIILTIIIALYKQKLNFDLIVVILKLKQPKTSRKELW